MDQFSAQKVYHDSGLAQCSVQETTRQRLERMKKHLQGNVADIDRTLELLNLHPELEELTDLLRRV